MRVPPPQSGSPERERPGNPGPGHWLALVVFSLVALLVVPIVIRQRSSALRATATRLAEPARDLSEDVERDLAAQVGAARGFELTGDSTYVRRYRIAGANAERGFARLRPLVAGLGPGPAAALAELHAGMIAWQQGTAIGRGREGAVGRPELSVEEPLFEATLTAAAKLDTAIGRAVAARRTEAGRMNAIAAAVTAVLVLLVLISVGLLFGVAQRLRQLAEESRRRAGEEEELRRELERTMESRARLIRGFSHDVRNPLGAADGYVQLLESGAYGPLSPQQKSSLGRVRGSIGAALVLIDDLLDLARLEAGQLQVSSAVVDVCALVDEGTEEYRAQVEQAGLRLEVELPQQPVVIRSDGRRIRQVLGNLLSNAVKYTTAGSVRVRLRCPAEMVPGPGEWLALDVTDTGSGIDVAQQPHVFDEFARLEPGAARGAGVGLAISLRLARAMGGEITLASEPGVGSTFTLWLPLTLPG